MLSASMLSVSVLSVSMLSVSLMSVIILIVIMINAIIMNVGSILQNSQQVCLSIASILKHVSAQFSILVLSILL
jgi:hypothetical protein